MSTRDRGHCIRSHSTPSKAKSFTQNLRLSREQLARERLSTDPNALLRLEEIRQLLPKPQPRLPYCSQSIIDNLHERRERERVNGLEGVTTLLGKRFDREDFNERHAVTVLYRCLHILKKASTKEAKLALKVIGLLSITLDCDEKLAEIYREVLDAPSANASCLKKDLATAINMLECVGVVTFFSAVGADETQKGMKIIWDFLTSKKQGHYSQETLVGAIYSWCFLLTSTVGWRLNQNWRGAISFFMEILDKNDHGVLVHDAASVALALIFETEALEKFWDGEKDSTLQYPLLEEKLRVMVLNKMTSLDLNPNVVHYFKTLCFKKSSTFVCDKELELTSWYHVIQLAFMKSFLGKEFDNFMTKEDKLQGFFEVKPYEYEVVEEEEEELFEPIIEKVPTVKVVMPGDVDREMMTGKQVKRDKVRRTNIMDKAKTQLRTKQRLVSQALDSFDFL